MHPGHEGFPLAVSGYLAEWFLVAIYSALFQMGLINLIVSTFWRWTLVWGLSFLALLFYYAFFHSVLFHIMFVFWIGL